MANSKDIIDICKIAFMYVAVTMEKILGGYDGILIVLTVFISVDYITGIICGFYKRKLSSDLSFSGILKKMFMLCIVALTVLIETHIFKTNTLRSAVILYYISNEGISILENFSALGVPIPDKLKRAMLKLKDDDDTDELKKT